MNTPDLKRLLSPGSLLASLVVLFVVGRGIVFFYYDDVVVWPDSEDYATIATYPTWSSRLWMAHRPPVYPYILKFFTERNPTAGTQAPLVRGLAGYQPKVSIGRGLEGDANFIVNTANVNVTAVAVFQLVVAVFAWCVFALTATSNLPRARYRLAGVALILLIGLDQNVTLWDRHVLTESLSISLFLLLTALCIAYVRSPRRELLLIAAVLALLYGGIKGTNPYVLLAFSAMMFAAPWLRQTRWRQGFAFCGALFLVVAALNIYSADKGYRGVVPFQNILTSRIIADGYEDTLAFFRASGMPEVPASFFEQNWYAPFDTKPALQQWIIADGPATYKKYLITHPGYLFIRPFTTPVTTYNLPVYVYYDAYLALYGQPKALGTTLFFARYSFAVFFVCGIIAVALAGRRFAKKQDVEPLFFGYLFVTGVLLSILVWHGDLIENSRHMVQVTVQLRLATLLLAIYAVAALLPPARASGRSSANLP